MRTLREKLIEYIGGQVFQRWRGLGGDWNLRVTLAYLVIIY